MRSGHRSARRIEPFSSNSVALSLVHMGKSTATLPRSSTSSGSKLRPPKQAKPAPAAIPYGAPTAQTPLLQWPVKLEPQVSNAITSSGSKLRPPKQAKPAPAAIPYGAPTAQTPSLLWPVKLEPRVSNAITRNWSPYDDGIEIGLLAASTDHKLLSREELDARIDSVLGGPSTKKRLLVFVEVCRE